MYFRNTKGMKREERKPTRCNNSDIYCQLQTFIINNCLNMFRASLCPSLGEQRPYMSRLKIKKLRVHKVQVVGLVDKLPVPKKKFSATMNGASREMRMETVLVYPKVVFLNFYGETGKDEE